MGLIALEMAAELLSEAYQHLASADFVLGPATDGGYYLIGLRRPIPELFTGMPWGSDRVFGETQHRARQLGLTCHLLATLSDVDRPEDLPVWRRISPPPTDLAAASQLSVVIPTLHEAEELPSTLSALMTDCWPEKSSGPDIIVVDGGSTDETARIVADAGCRVVNSAPPRARQ